jgi:hypothetical protein
MVMQPAELAARLEFEFEVSNPGIWHVWVRTLATDSANNGLFLELDGRRIVAGSEDRFPGVEALYLRKDSHRFHWRPEWQGPGEGNHAGPIRVAIASAGRHRLALVRRKTEAPLVDGIVPTRAAEPAWLSTPDLPGPLPISASPQLP